MSTVIFGSRRRLVAFWDLALVSNQMAPSTTAYHMATACGWPLGPLVTMVAVRLRSRYCTISSWLISILLRSFVPMDADPTGNDSEGFPGARSIRAAAVRSSGAGGQRARLEQRMNDMP